MIWDEKAGFAQARPIFLRDFNSNMRFLSSLNLNFILKHSQNIRVRWKQLKQPPAICPVLIHKSLHWVFTNLTGDFLYWSDIWSTGLEFYYPRGHYLTRININAVHLYLLSFLAVRSQINAHNLLLSCWNIKFLIKGNCKFA